MLKILGILIEKWKILQSLNDEEKNGFSPYCHLSVQNGHNPNVRRKKLIIKDFASMDYSEWFTKRLT